MAKPVLSITWDGNVPGLEDRRLSLGSFEKALRELLSAIRRIATDLEKEAWPTHSVQYPGRLTAEASHLDLQLRAITANSPITIELDVVEVNPPRRPLLADLGERAVARFLEDLRLEARGTAAHYKVRSFLRALPKGLTRQRYIQQDANGETLAAVDLGELQPVAPPEAVPHLIEVIGEVAGVGFEPGKTEVKLRAFSGEAVTFSATSEQVEQAVDMRLTQVIAVGVVESARTRLLRLSTSRGLIEKRNVADQIFEQWSAVLHRLAQ